VQQGGMASLPMDHASILRTIENLLGTVPDGKGGFHFKRRFKDPGVRTRIDRAGSMLSCFDANFVESKAKKNKKPDFNAVELSYSKWKNLPNITYHTEIRDTADKLPWELRKEAQEPILDDVMAIGEELGAVKLKA